MTTTKRQTDTHQAQAARVADYLEDNPDSTVKEIDTGCDVGSISKVLSAMPRMGYGIYKARRRVEYGDGKYTRDVRTYALMHRPELQNDQSASLSHASDVSAPHGQEIARCSKSSCTKRMTDYLISHLAWRRSEVFTVIFLDARFKMIRAENLFWGSMMRVNINITKIPQAARRHNAQSIIVAHNHSTGPKNTELAAPSDRDIAFTRRLQLVMYLVGIPLHDHIIVGADKTSYSMADRGPWGCEPTEFMRLIYLEPDAHF